MVLIPYSQSEIIHLITEAVKVHTVIKYLFFPDNFILPLRISIVNYNLFNQLYFHKLIVTFCLTNHLQKYSSHTSLLA